MARGVELRCEAIRESGSGAVTADLEISNRGLGLGTDLQVVGRGYVAHSIEGFLRDCAQSLRKRLIRVWYGIPLS